MALGHEEELHGKGVAFRLAVERRQKRIIAEFFQDEPPVEVGGQAVSKGSFARADVALYGDEVGKVRQVI